MKIKDFQSLKCSSQKLKSLLILLKCLNLLCLLWLKTIGFLY